jgi:hypothetical protein
LASTAQAISDFEKLLFTLGGNKMTTRGMHFPSQVGTNKNAIQLLVGVTVGILVGIVLLSVIIGVLPKDTSKSPLNGFPEYLNSTHYNFGTVGQPLSNSQCAEMSPTPPQTGADPPISP